MRLSFRVTLLTVLIGLLGATIAALQWNSASNTQYVVRDLTSQLFDQVFSRVDQRIELLLDLEERQAHVHRDLILKRLEGSGRSELSASDLDWMVGYFYDCMEIHPHLSTESFTVQDTGEYCHVRRREKDWKPQPSATGAQPAQPLSLMEIRLAEGGRRVLTESFVDARGQRCVIRTVPNSSYDPRRASLYQSLVKDDREVPGTPPAGSDGGGREQWSEVHIVQRDSEGMRLGVTLVTPVRRPGGTLLGALQGTFDVDALSEYMRSFDLGSDGLVFLLEIAASGEEHVIAHPAGSSLLTRPTGNRGAPALVPMGDVDDPRVRRMMEAFPAMKEATHSAMGVQCEVGGVPYLAGFHILRSSHGQNWRVCVMIPESHFLKNVYRHQRIALAISVACIVVALLLGLGISGLVARPLVQIVREVDAIGGFTLQAQPKVRSSIVEVDRLAGAVEDMKTSLRSFQKYVPTDLVRRVLASGQEARLGGERRPITVHFSDLAGFTGIAEHVEPEQLVETLGEYLGAMSGEILAQGGTVDKYIGDAIMAFWGAPQPMSDHALAACRTALRNQRRLAELRESWRAQGRPVFSCRVGLHTGEAVVGNIGSEFRLDYTAIGDTVNLASRLEGLNKFYGTEILISQSTLDAVGDQVRVRVLDRVSVKGKQRGIEVYELLAMREDDTPDLSRLASLSDSAFQAYLERDWSRAIAAWEEVLTLRPADCAASLLLARCQAYQRTPPPPDWDGAWQMTQK